MTKEQWMEIVRENKEDLRSLIRNYHPASGSYSPESMPITAVCAELACENIRREIRQSRVQQPIEAFERAVEASDCNTIDSLLNSAWFGVPESTSCWRIRGFKVAVDLMDDPPEEEDAE